MAPPGGDEPTDKLSNVWSMGVVFQGENFPSWKKAFEKAAVAEGWLQHFFNPAYDDPRAIVETMTKLQLTMEFEALRNPVHAPANMADKELNAWKLEQTGKQEARKQQIFQELFELTSNSYKAKAKEFLLANIGASVQEELKTLDNPYHLYTALLNRYDVQQPPVAILRQIHDTKLAFGANLDSHFEKMDHLLYNFRSSIVPARWAHLSVDEYDKMVWNNLKMALLQHSLRDISVEALFPWDPKHPKSTDELKTFIRNLFPALAPMGMTKDEAINDVCVKIEPTDSAAVPTPSLTPAPKLAAAPVPPASNPVVAPSSSEPKPIANPIPPTGNSVLTPDDQVPKAVAIPIRAVPPQNSEPTAPTTALPNLHVIPSEQSKVKVEESPSNASSKGGPSALPPMKVKVDIDNEPIPKKKKPPVDEWSIPKKPKVMEKPPKCPPTGIEPNTVKTEIKAETKPTLTRRLSTSSIRNEALPVVPDSSPTSALNRTPTVLGRRASTSNLPPNILPVQVHIENDKMPDGPIPKRRRKEEKASRWAPKAITINGATESGESKQATEDASSQFEDMSENLSKIVVPDASKIIPLCVYVSNLNHNITEVTLEVLCNQFGLQMDEQTLYPRIDVFMCQRTRRPRGDAVLYFHSTEGAKSAIELLQGKQVKNVVLKARQMDSNTLSILQRQIHDEKLNWNCHGCRAQVSMWRPHCDGCSKPRVFPPSQVDINPTDWLCKICLTANAKQFDTCGGCKLPKKFKA